MSQLQLPEALKGLYTDDCIAYRGKINSLMQRFLETRKRYATRAEREYFQSLEGDLTIPSEAILEELGLPVNIIGLAGEKKGGVFVLTEHYGEGERFARSAGKTALGLRILGIEVPYAGIPGSVDVLKGGDLHRLLAREGTGRIIASDKIYAGQEGGYLAIGAPQGEQVLAQWDLARHINRMKGFPDYESESQDPEAMAYQEALGEWYCLDSSVFADSSQVYPVSSIFVVARGDGSGVGMRELVPSPDLLKELLLGNPYHFSRFWGINREEHGRRVERIVAGVGFLPAVWEVELPPSSFEEAAEKITGLMDV